MKTRVHLALLIALGMPVGALAQGPMNAFPTPQIQNVSNAPNPFDSRRDQTQIRYVLASNAEVHVTIYDLFGFRVQQWTFMSGSTGGREGQNQFFWDGTNAAGQKVSKGGYIAYIEVHTDAGIVKTWRKIGVIH